MGLGYKNSHHVFHFLQAGTHYFPLPFYSFKLQTFALIARFLIFIMVQAKFLSFIFFFAATSSYVVALPLPTGDHPSEYMMLNNHLQHSHWQPPGSPTPPASGENPPDKKPGEYLPGKAPGDGWAAWRERHDPPTNVWVYNSSNPRFTLT